jgi:hypothetical protein
MFRPKKVQDAFSAQQMMSPTCRHPLNSGDAMSAFSIVAAAGLITLASGVLLVNAVSTPRSAQVGTIIAGLGVLILVVVAVRQLFV